MKSMATSLFKAKEREERRGRRGVIGQMMAGTELNKESNY